MNESTNRRVWGIGTSRTLRAHWMMAELDLDYETMAILTRSAAMESEAFQALSRRGKIPILEDGDLVMGESAAISIYLADRYREKAALTPQSGTNAHAIHEELCFFVMTELDAPLYIIRRHEGLPEIYGESRSACDAARSYFLRSLQEIERRLAQGQHFLLGPNFQVADLLLKTCLDWAGICDIEVPEPLGPYSERISTRPAYQRAIAINFTPESMAALRRTQ